MTLAQAREQVASALSTVDGVSVRTRTVTSPAPGDGWVVVQRLAPATFGTCHATLAAVVVLGTEDAAAETRLDTLAVPLLDALTCAVPAGDVVLEPNTINVGSNGAPVLAAVLTLTMEV